jgi:hypothetical protein
MSCVIASLIPKFLLLQVVGYVTFLLLHEYATQTEVTHRGLMIY